MLKVTLDRKYYDDTIFFKKSHIEFQPGVTVLVGCNGYGKTTMLQGIAAQCRKDKIPYIEFESIGDRRDERNRTTLDGDMDYLTNVFISSEGEEIGMTLCKFAGKLGNFIRSNSSAEEIAVLIDALDSGFSIDNIVEAKESLFRFVIDDCKKNNTTLYVIVSANAYELASGERCFDPIKGEYISFENYEQYRNYILNTRKVKDKRYKD